MWLVWRTLAHAHAAMCAPLLLADRLLCAVLLETNLLVDGIEKAHSVLQLRMAWPSTEPRTHHVHCVLSNNNEHFRLLKLSHYILRIQLA